ncbi:hypothetical protein [Castellaniella sp. S9]|uniref:hypothetical protein n=1 Tax=Castellaniella sp. S9 TaxID=2993652 RepID=UPI0022B417AC|nr:hypothetical protein [Castellaniella sp. S9]
MRDYGKIHTSFWSSKTIGMLSDDGKMLALYLLTSPHSTISGVFRLPDGYVCEDMGWSSERVSKGFDELLGKGFANRCETTKWVYICKHFEWNKPENPNQRKAAKKIALSVPDECGWKPIFMRDWRDFLEISDEEYSSSSETVPEPFLNQEQEQEQEQDISAEQKPLALVPEIPPAPEPDPVAELPLNTGPDHRVMPDDVAAWAQAFPAVDIEAELKRMSVWLTANPRKRKTARGINAFIVSWLTRQQDKPRQGNQGGATDQYGVPL